MSKKTILIALAGLVALLVLSAGILNAAGMLNTASNDTDELMVEVTITNLTRGQTMTSVFVARHDRNAGPLYTLGQPAATGWRPWRRMVTPPACVRRGIRMRIAASPKPE